MLIVCPSCATSYRLDAAKLGPNGRAVRCNRCKTVWHATERLSELAVPLRGQSGNVLPFPIFSDVQEALPRVRENYSGSDWVEEPDGPEMLLPDPAANENGVTAEDNAVQDAVSLPETNSPPLMPSGWEREPTMERERGERSAVRTWHAARRHADLFAATIRALGWFRPFPVLVVTLAAVIAMLIGFRVEMVRLFPHSGSLFRALGFAVNPGGLEIDAVKTTREMQDGVPVLIVEGTVSNVLTRTLKVPRLRFEMLDAAGMEIYAWTMPAARSLLAAGESTPFRTRLASPPAEGREVTVRFVTAEDRVAGLR